MQSARSTQLTTGDGLSPEMCERALACAVVLRAIEDARCTAPSATSYSLHQPHGSDVSMAWQFLTAERGQWAESRVRWCDAAGIDPEALRQRILAGAGESARAAP